MTSSTVPVDPIAPVAPKHIGILLFAHLSQVRAPERTIAVEAKPRTISQMANVSSNNPPGMAATSPAPATPNISKRLPPAKHA